VPRADFRSAIRFFGRACSPRHLVRPVMRVVNENFVLVFIRIG
jgi:hypothetical protein